MLEVVGKELELNVVEDEEGLVVSILKLNEEVVELLV